MRSSSGGFHQGPQADCSASKAGYKAATRHQHARHRILLHTWRHPYRNLGSQRHLPEVAEQLYNCPRKSFGFRAADEVMSERNKELYSGVGFKH